MTSTAAMASDATTQVEPHSSANWMIDFVSSSMKPTPRKKKCHEKRPADCPSTPRTAITENASTSARAMQIVTRHVRSAHVEERPVVGRRDDRWVARAGARPG